MAGHSKWANIKHKKAKEDAKRGKIFTRIIKEITAAARTGGGDPAGNPRLRQLVDKAKAANMPLDNIDRAIKKGTGELPGVAYEAQTYEGYGPFGVAILVETLTDNKNRTVAELRYLFSAKGGNLGESGSVSWMFERLGVVRAQGEKTEDELLEALLDFDIKDISCDEGMCTVQCDLKSLDAVRSAVEATSMIVEDADPEWVANNFTELDEDQTQKVFQLLEALENQDDVQNVYATVA